MNIAYPILDTEIASRDVLQCLHTLYSTPAGSVTLDRDFGLDISGILDMPMETAKNRYALEVISKTEKYEPRVRISRVKFSSDPETGLIMPKIRILWADDYTGDEDLPSDDGEIYDFWNDVEVD